MLKKQQQTFLTLQDH